MPKPKYRFIPKDADNWKRVMDITKGKGIAPQKKFYASESRLTEYEEYKENIPKPLRRLNSPYKPDVVAAMLELEDEEALYEWLKYKKPSTTEAEHNQIEGEEFLERDEELRREIIKIKRDAKDEKYNRLPSTIDNKIRKVKQYLEENPAEARKTLSSGTCEVKRVRIGAPMIKKFLGWNLTKVQESLERINLIDKGIVDQNAVYLFPTQASAINFAKAVKKYKLKRKHQKQAAKKLVNSETYGKKDIEDTIEEISFFSKYKPKKLRIKPRGKKEKKKRLFKNGS
ncbi:MAG: hypothetical protein GTN73_09745 [Candidatus Aminicenantes bacterium]|nr:hypothetical protein [Candidatus Aminicenantes bacterium]